MYSNLTTDTRILIIDNNTIVIHREKENPFRFRILINSAFRGYVEHKERLWQLSAQNSISKGLLAKIKQKLGITF